MSKLLIVEDEPTLRNVLITSMRNEGYEVHASGDGAEALELARAVLPDLCLLDVMLPGMDGLSLCRILRKESDAAIILLTARGAEMDRVIGLETGADDYVQKPFSMPELTARIRAALRRSTRRQSDKIRCGDLEVDLAARMVIRNGSVLKLSYKEYELLATLLRNKGVVLTRDFLLAQVWGYDYDGDPRTLDVHVRWLREKIEQDASSPLIVQTVRGVGYRVV